MKRFSILTSILVLTLSGCSYFQRKSCESTNWFEHGKQVALRGQRLTGNNMVEKCRKVEADISDSQLDLGWKAGQGEYCSLSGAYMAGREGRSFNGEICNASDFAKLAAENKKGIRDYCVPENGEELGRKGQTYEKVCPDNLMKNFVLAYNKGRKAFLGKKVEQLKSELFAKESNLRFQQGRLEGYRANLLHAEGRLHGLSANATAAERANAQAQYDDARSQTSHIEFEVNSLDTSIRGLKSEMFEAEQELAGL